MRPSSSAVACALTGWLVVADTGDAQQAESPFRGELHAAPADTYSARGWRTPSSDRHGPSLRSEFLVGTGAKRAMKGEPMSCGVGRAVGPCWRVSNSPFMQMWRLSRRDRVADWFVLSAPFEYAAGMDHPPAASVEGERSPNGEWESMMGWSPKEGVRAGEQLLDELNAAAERGFAVPDAGELRRVVLRTAGLPAEDWGTVIECLRECTSLTGPDGSYGPPMGCRTLARWDGRSVWLPIWFGVRPKQEYGCATCLMGERDDSLHISGPPELAPRLINLAAAALGAAPLRLATKIDDRRTSMIGLAERGRPSPVLNLREWGSIRVDAYERADMREEPRRSDYRLDVAVTIVVNPQNTANPADWRPLTETEAASYVTVVRKQLHPAMAGVCRGRWSDDFRYECERPSTGPRKAPSAGPAPRPPSAFFAP